MGLTVVGLPRCSGCGGGCGGRVDVAQRGCCPAHAAGPAAASPGADCLSPLSFLLGGRMFSFASTVLSFGFLG
jgi:hypothetical protein